MKSALIVIDMQKDFCYPDGSLFGGEHIKNIFEPVNRAVQEAREKMPVIFTQDWHRKDDVEFKIWPPHCIADTRGAEIIDEISMIDGVSSTETAVVLRKIKEDFRIKV